MVDAADPIFFVDFFEKKKLVKKEKKCVENFLKVSGETHAEIEKITDGRFLGTLRFWSF